MEVVGSLMSLVFLGSLSFGTAIEALQVCKYTFALINLQRAFAFNSRYFFIDHVPQWAFRFDASTRKCIHHCLRSLTRLVLRFGFLRRYYE